MNTVSILPVWRHLTFPEIAERVANHPSNLRLILSELTSADEYSVQASGYFLLGAAQALCAFESSDPLSPMDQMRKRQAIGIAISGKVLHEAGYKLGDFFGEHRIFGRPRR